MHKGKSQITMLQSSIFQPHHILGYSVKMIEFMDTMEHAADTKCSSCPGKHAWAFLNETNLQVILRALCNTPCSHILSNTLCSNASCNTLCSAQCKAKKTPLCCVLCATHCAWLNARPEEKTPLCCVLSATHCAWLNARPKKKPLLRALCNTLCLAQCKACATPLN